MLPCSHVSSYFGEHSVFVTDRNDGHNYKNKTQVVINWNYPLRSFVYAFLK